MLTNCIPALSVLMKCESDRNLSLLGGPLSWFMTGLLSLIYKAQGGVQFHIPGTIHVDYLLGIGPSLKEEGLLSQITFDLGQPCNHRVSARVT